MVRRSLLVLMASVVLLGSAACGGGGGGDSSSEDAGSGSEPAEESEIGDAASADAPAEAEPEESGPGAEDPAAPAEGGQPEGGASTPDVSFTGESSTAFCSQMADIESSFAGVEQSEQALADLAAKVRAITPPPELAADWPLFVEMNDSLASGEELSESDVEANADRYGTASSRVSEYITQICGL